MKNLTYNNLVSSIRQVHDTLSAQADKAINISLTLRNWLIGCYIERYERNGADRARYGERLMDDLAVSLGKLNLPRCDRRELYRYLRFYQAYPRIVETVPPQFSIAALYSPPARTSRAAGSALKEALAFYAGSGGKGDPAETQQKAVDTVLKQAEVLADYWVEADLKI